MANIILDTQSSGVSSGPYAHAMPVTPSDTIDLPNVTRAIYVGGAGSVTVLLLNGPTPVTFTAAPVGSIIPVQASRVMSTGTSATLLVALW